MGNFRYLIKVEPDANNNKFYKMIENGSSFEVQYGRVGNTNYQTASYGISMWDKKYREKIKKGYEDKTDLVAEIEVTTKDNSEFSKINKFSIFSIVEKLQKYANKSIKENYTVSSSSVTQKMIDSADEKINELLTIEDLNKFNEELINLFKIIPRKMSSVKLFLANSKDDFGNIINKERDTLDVMRGQVYTPIAEIEEKDINKNVTILDSIGVVMDDVTQDEISEIKTLMGDISGNFGKAWRVQNSITQEKYNSFIKSNNIIEKKLLFHGTRSENVWNILKTGLLLRPQAKINGKMFGHGIYFAPKARKSLGYTSLGGSYWAGGNSKEGYMLIFEVGYGVPYDVYSFDSKYYDMDYENLQKCKLGANSLHAHATNNMLRNDEIIVYKQEQVTVKYLIELKQ